MSPPRAYSKRAGQNSPFAIRKNMPASCPPFRFQYSAAAQRWAGKAEYFSCTKDFPQNAAKKTGRLPLTPTSKRVPLILSSLRTKSAAGTAACPPPFRFAHTFGISAAGSEWGECSKKNRGGFLRFPPRRLKKLRRRLKSAAASGIRSGFATRQAENAK